MLQLFQMFTRMCILKERERTTTYQASCFITPLILNRAPEIRRVKKVPRQALDQVHHSKNLQNVPEAETVLCTKLTQTCSNNTVFFHSEHPSLKSMSSNGNPSFKPSLGMQSMLSVCHFSHFCTAMLTTWYTLIINQTGSPAFPFKLGALPTSSVQGPQAV